MNPRRKIVILATAFLLGLGLLASFLAPQTPVAEAGQWCGQSCGNSVFPPPTETY
jgi:hypothetical protein